MNCHELARRLSELRPDLTPVDVARLCLILLNICEDTERLRNDAYLMKLWQQAAFRFESAADQHAAVVTELENLLGNGPIQFTPDQLWTLLRAVKVQGQMLELFTENLALA